MLRLQTVQYFAIDGLAMVQNHTNIMSDSVSCLAYPRRLERLPYSARGRERMTGASLEQEQ